jgi:bacteriorhodopsin
MASSHSLLTARGEDALYFCWISFTITTVVFAYFCFREKPHRREHIYAALVVAATAALSYYAMATGGGKLPVEVDGVHREIYWARYVDWSITTPLLLLELILMAQLPAAAAGFIIAADIGMVVTGLIGALTEDASRWGWFVFGCIFMVAIFYFLLTEGQLNVAQRDRSLVALYTSSTWGLVLLWTAYPIVWALAEGTNYISADVEAFAYAVLDITAKIGWGTFIVHNNGRLMASYGKGSADEETPLLEE